MNRELSNAQKIVLKTISSNLRGLIIRVDGKSEVSPLDNITSFKALSVHVMSPSYGSIENGVEEISKVYFDWLNGVTSKNEDMYLFYLENGTWGFGTVEDLTDEEKDFFYVDEEDSVF